MDAGDADVAFAPRAHGAGDGRHRRLQIQDADADAEDIDTVRHLRFDDLRFTISTVRTARKSYIVNRKSEMKLLVFAHVPPPHHGQSYAVKLMLESFGGNRRKPALAGGGPGRFGIECYHVNARYSKTLEDIGEFQGGKIFLILFYCLQAVWCRFRYGVDVFYYVPAPGKPVALYRDWLVMLVCRPFFKKIIFHWHAAGLAKWLETAVSIRTRSFTYRRMRDADLSIVLSEFNRRDAEKLTARRVAIVAAAFPIRARNLKRKSCRAAARAPPCSKKSCPAIFGARMSSDKIVNVLFLAHCTREKGVFDAVEGVALANEKLAAEKSPLRFRLTLIGAFASGAEEQELRELIQRRGLQIRRGMSRLCFRRTQGAGVARGRLVLFSDLLQRRKPARQPDRGDGVWSANRHDALAFRSRNAAAGLSRHRGPEIAGANRRLAAPAGRDGPRRAAARNIFAPLHHRAAPRQHGRGHPQRGKFRISRLVLVIE